MSRIRILKPALAAFAAVIIGSALVLGCSSDDDDGGNATGSNQPTSVAVSGSEEERAVESTIRDTIQAYSAANTDQFLSYWTDEGLMNEFGASRDDIRAAGAEFFGGPPIEVGEFENVDVQEDSATAEFDFIFGAVVQPQRYSLVQEGTAWKINDTESMDAEIPDDATKVDMTLDEMSFGFDTSGVKTNVAFALDNAGEQPHEAILLKVPAGFTVDQLLQADPSTLPSGVAIVGFAGPFEPGDSGTMVFSDPIPAGSYMFVCFVPDTTDPAETPHAAKGMATTFEVTQ
jgi:hypothetical protein